MPPPTVIGPVVRGASRFRFVTGAPGASVPIVEQCIGTDALGVESWQSLRPDSPPMDIWNALQAALTRIA